MHRRAERVHRAYGGVADGVGHRLLIRKDVRTRTGLEVAAGKARHRRFYRPTAGTPGAEATVQHRHPLVAKVVKQPPGARRPHHAAAAVEHDAAVHVDAKAPEQFLQRGGFRQGEFESAGRVGRVTGQVKKLGSGNVPAIKGNPAQFALHAGTPGFEIGGGLEDTQIGISERAFELVDRDQVVAQNRFHRDVTPGNGCPCDEYSHLRKPQELPKRQSRSERSSLTAGPSVPPRPRTAAIAASPRQ